MAGARYVDMTVEMDLTPDVSAAAAATEEVFEQTVDKVAGIVQDAVEGANNDIANSVRRSPPTCRKPHGTITKNTASSFSSYCVTRISRCDLSVRLPDCGG